MTVLKKIDDAKPKRVLSGGQTGVDRAVLDWALSSGIIHGGWCPRCRIAQDGPLPERYQLAETESSGYSQRTRMNVRDADATLIIHHGPMAGGTRLTFRFANELQKPIQMVDLCKNWPSQTVVVQAWWNELGLSSLNIAGPSEERIPGVYELTTRFLQQLWPFSSNIGISLLEG